MMRGAVTDATSAPGPPAASTSPSTTGGSSSSRVAYSTYTAPIALAASMRLTLFSTIGRSKGLPKTHRSPSPTSRRTLRRSGTADVTSAVRILASAAAERYSVPFFLNPAYSAVYAPLPSTIDARNPPRYRPINWREFRAKRAAGDYADYGEYAQLSQYAL